MNEQIKLAISITVIIVTLAIGYGFRGLIHRCPECPECPEIVARSHVEREIVGPQPDTARVVKYAPSINRTKVPAVQTVAPIPADHRADSMVRFSVVDTMTDNVVIGYSLASKEFPDRYLPDMVHDAWYLANPDRFKYVIDTLTVQLPPLKCPSRWQREVIICGVSVGVAVVATVGYFTFK